MRYAFLALPLVDGGCPIFVTAASDCDPLVATDFAKTPYGVSYLWTPGGGAAGVCEVTFTNDDDTPVDVTSVAVDGTVLTVTSRSLAGAALSFGEPGITFPIVITPGKQLGLVVFAAPSTLPSATGSFTWLTDAGNVSATLDARFADPRPVATADCAPGGPFATCSAYALSLPGGGGSRVLRIENQADVVLEVNGVGFAALDNPVVQASTTTPLPFFVDPGETRDLDVGLTPTGTGSFSGTWIAGNLNNDRVVASVAVNGSVGP